MREIVLDTETTGLDPAEGHRVVEIGAVELLNHLPTGRTFHRYINPERAMPEDAFKIHGLSTAFLAGHPPFAEIAAEFLEFLERDGRGEAVPARLVIHNASFDIKFLNSELARLGQPPLLMDRVIDSLQLARQKFPNAPASLDALCRRFAVDASARVKHGALLDCELLAEVYLGLIGGRQPDLGLVVQAAKRSVAGPQIVRTPRPPRPHAPSAEELAAHAAFLVKLKAPIWTS
jgi:DNA polymerase-3 subunit epsilon